MKKKLSFIFIATLAITLLSSFTFAQNRGFGPNGKGQARMFKYLDLTDAQQSKIDDLRYNHRMEVLDKKAELEKTRMEIAKMFKDNNVDESKIMSLVEKSNEIRSEMRKSAMAMKIKIYNLLTDEQKAKFGDMPFMGRHGGFGPGMGKGMGFRHGMKGQGYGPRGGRGYGMRDGSCRYFNN